MVVAGSLSLESLNEVALLSLLAVESVLLLALLIGESGSLITCLVKFKRGYVIGLSGLLEVIVLVFANFGEFGGSLLLFEQIVLSGLNLLISCGILTLLVAIDVTKTIDLLLVTATLFLQLLQLKVSSVDVLSESV